MVTVLVGVALSLLLQVLWYCSPAASPLISCNQTCATLPGNGWAKHKLRPRASRKMAAERPRSAPRARRRVLQMTTVSEAPGVTNPKYWEKAAEDWEDIQDTFTTDLWGTIRRTMARHLTNGSYPDMCIDFGCGGGRYLRFLAKHCRKVLGIDIADGLIRMARREVAFHRLTNVDLRVADIGCNGVLESLGPTLPRCSVAVCTNVLLSPEPMTRHNILRLMAF